MVLSNELKQLKISQLDKMDEFLRNNDVINLQSGKYDLGDECFAVVSEYETKANEEIVYEAHKKYIDVQYLIYGREMVWLTKEDASACVQAYDNKGDYALYKSEDKIPVILPAKYFLVLYPEDLHSPGYAVGEKKKVKKIVFKIKKNEVNN